MVVTGESMVDPSLAHDRHRNAVGEAVTLVFTRFVEGNSPQKQLARLSNDRHTRIAQDAFDRSDGSETDCGTFIGEGIEVFRRTPSEVMIRVPSSEADARVALSWCWSNGLVRASQ